MQAGLSSVAAIQLASKLRNIINGTFKPIARSIIYTTSTNIKIES